MESEGKCNETMYTNYLLTFLNERARPSGPGKELRKLKQHCVGKLSYISLFLSPSL